ncbi:MAG TPA: hypothetical protein VEJ84_20460, partial [Acidimicrobiales bacterium]|nr:hypothetical protein [Acidimicrobiales bacterium]
RQYERAANLLSEDLTIEVPINSYSSKAEFLAAARGIRETGGKLTPIAELSNTDEAVLVYDMELPIGTLRRYDERDGSEDV